jgi:hypothetical protein
LSDEIPEDFSLTLAVSQTYENVRPAMHGLNELNQNIRRYAERAAKQMKLPTSCYVTAAISSIKFKGLDV